jgi:hypothetical protein
MIMAATEPTSTALEALFRPTKNDESGVRAVELLPGLHSGDGDYIKGILLFSSCRQNHLDCGDHARLCSNQAGFVLAVLLYR